MKWLSSFSIFLLLILISWGCRKDNYNIKYVMSGRLLESSSNPIPVKNYKVQVYQRSGFGLLGSFVGMQKEFATDANGYFNFVYTPTRSTGLSAGIANTYPLSFTGIDTISYKGLFPDWSPLPPNKDTAMQTIYLYKKIARFVRKIQFDAELARNDSIEVITIAAYRSHYKTIYGPIPAGTLLILDTIVDYKVERYDVTTRSYAASTVIKRPAIYKGFALTLPLGDELYREQTVIFQ